MENGIAVAKDTIVLNGEALKGRHSLERHLASFISSYTPKHKQLFVQSSLVAESVLNEYCAQDSIPLNTVLNQLGIEHEYTEEIISGTNLRSVLVSFIKDLSIRARFTAEDFPGGIVTTEAIAARLGVSTKFVDRQRENGLLTTRYFYVNGQKRFRVGFLHSSVDAFYHHFSQRTYIPKRQNEIAGKMRTLLGKSSTRADHTMPINGDIPPEIAERIQKISDLKYIESPQFHEQGAKEVIVDAPYPNPAKPPKASKAPAGTPAYLAALYENPLLTREQEQYLFRKYNYLKYHIIQGIKTLLKTHPVNEELLTELESIYADAMGIKKDIIRANLRLVVSIVKKWPEASSDIFAAFSDGNDSLMKAVEKFDYIKGNKFSTYATWAIENNRSRGSIQKQEKVNGIEQSNASLFDDDQLRDPCERSPRQICRIHELQAAQLEELCRAALTKREHEIIYARYGIGNGIEPQTLESLGGRFGVTKERIRQLEMRALQKLQKLVEQGVHPVEDDM